MKKSDKAVYSYLEEVSITGVTYWTCYMVADEMQWEKYLIGLAL